MSVLEQETNLLSSVELSNPAVFSVRDEPPIAENCEKFVAFLLGSGIYCISSKAVIEVIHPLPVAPLPNAPASISGIAAFRGEVIAVINIKEILGLEQSNANAKAKLIILRSNAKDTQFAVPVDLMHELIAVSPVAVTDDPNAPPDGMTRLVEHESNVFKMIDPEILFERLDQSIA